MLYNRDVQDAVAQGYSPEQIRTQALEQYNDAVRQGYDPADAREVVKKMYGIDLSTTQEDLERAQFAASEVRASLEETTQKPSSSNAAKSDTKTAQSIGDAFLSGYQNSFTGLVLRGQKPELTVGPDAGIMQRVAQAMGQGLGDIPANLIGAAAGTWAGAPIAAATGPAAPEVLGVMTVGSAFAFPEFARESLMNSYIRGKATNFMEYVRDFGEAWIAGAKGFAMGATMGAAAKAAAPVAEVAASKVASLPYGKVLAPISKTGISLTTEAAAVTGVMSAYELKMPSMDDFLVNAITLGSMKTSLLYTKKGARAVKNMATDLYMDKFVEDFIQHGVTPDDVRQASIIDPKVKERVAALNQRIVIAKTPKFHKAQAVLSLEEAKSRGINPETVYTEADLLRSNENLRNAFKEASVQSRLERARRNKKAQTGEKYTKLTPEEEADLRAKYEKDFDKTPGAFLPKPTQHAGKWLYGSKVEAANQAQKAAGDVKLTTPEAFYEEVWIPKKGFYIKLQGNSDSLMAKVVREYMQSKEGRAELEARDPEFFKENPNWWEGRETIAEERLVPTARAIFESTTPEFVNFIRNHVWSTELATKMSDKPKAMPGLEQGHFIGNDLVTGVRIPWAGIIHDRGSAAGGTRYFIFDPKRLHPSAKNVTGETPYEKALSKFAEKVSIDEKPQRTWRERINNLVYNVVDSFHALNTGAERGKRSQAYVEAIVSNGASGRATFMIEHGMINNKGEVVGRPLGEILKGVMRDGGDRSEFSIYLAARHFKEQHDRGISTVMDPDVVVSILKGPRSEIYSKYADQLRDYNTQLLDYQLEAGLISKTKYDRLRRENKNSVSLDKMIEAFEPELKNEALRTSKGEQVDEPAKAGTKRTQGGKETKDGKLYIDPIESQIRATFLTTRLAMQNDARKTAAETYGVRIDSPTAKAPDMTTITYLDKGKTRRMAVPKEIRQATLAMDSGTFQMYNAAIKGLAKGASIFRIGTTMTPPFAAKNFIIDQLIAWLQAPGDVKYCPFVSAFKGIGEIFKTKVRGQESMYTEWLKDGGSQASLASLGRNFTQEMIKDLQRTPVQNMLKDPGKHWKELLWTLSPTNWVRYAYKGLESMTEYSDQVTRIGMYLEARKAGYSGKEAAYLSRNATIDFARSGATIKALNSIIAFLNARIQGSARIVETAKANPDKFISQVIRGVVIPSVLLELVNQDVMQSNQSPDDPHFSVAEALRQAPDWMKTAYWLVPVPSLGTVFRIPKPHELAVPAASVAESFIDYMAKLGSANELTFLEQLAENGITSGVYDTLVPNFTPTTVLPVTEVLTNYSYFTGNNVIPAYLENRVPALQYKSGTSASARFVSEMLFKMDPTMGSHALTRLASPLGIDHIVRGWGGTIGMTIISVMDKVLEASGMYTMPVQPSKTIEDWPFFKNFMVKYPTTGANDLIKFNAEANTIQQRYNSIKEGLKSLDPHAREVAQTLINSTAYANLQPMRQALSRMSKAVELINLTNNDPESKRIQIENIFIQMAQVAKQGRKLIKQIEKEMSRARGE